MNSFSSGLSSLRMRAEDAARGAARRGVHRLGVEAIQVGRGLDAEQRCGAALPAVLVEQAGPDRERIEEALQLHARQLLDLLLGVVGAALLLHAGADLPHDFLDIHGIGAHGKLGHGW